MQAEQNIHLPRHLSSWVLSGHCSALPGHDSLRLMASYQSQHSHLSVAGRCPTLQKFANIHVYIYIYNYIHSSGNLNGILAVQSQAAWLSACRSGVPEATSAATNKAT